MLCLCRTPEQLLLRCTPYGKTYRRQHIVRVLARHRDGTLTVEDGQRRLEHWPARCFQPLPPRGRKLSLRDRLLAAAWDRRWRTRAQLRAAAGLTASAARWLPSELCRAGLLQVRYRASGRFALWALRDQPAWSSGSASACAGSAGVR
jgi:hypothetical protein